MKTITKPLNRVTLGRIFMFLHSKSSHPLNPKDKRWRKAEQRFKRRHMPYVHGRTNCKWHNTRTAGGWL